MRTDVELLRIISAFGITWFHSNYYYGREVAYSGLVVFLIFTSYFAMLSSRKNSIKARASRLLIPCLLWSFLYSFISLIRGQNIFPENNNILSAILSTPSIHLWYLPFAFISIILIDRAKYINLQVTVFVALIVATFLLLTAYFWRQWDYVPPLAQYIHATPAILMGLVFAIQSRLSNIQRLFILFVILMITLSLFLSDLPGVSTPYIIGILASLVLLKEKTLLPHFRIIFALSRLTFGVYLLHPLVIFLLKHFGINDFKLPILSFLISILVIHIVYSVVPEKLRKFLI